MEQHEILNWSNSFNVSKVSDIQKFGNLSEVSESPAQSKALISATIRLALISIAIIL